MTLRALACTLLGLSIGPLAAADHPEATISNGVLSAKLYLPDARSGFYRGTRFDWSGVIYSLKFQGHDFYGPWFHRFDPAVRDFVWDHGQVVAGRASAITGPADEFGEVGWQQTRTGGNFLKIGVGALRKPDDQPYDQFRSYEIAVPGTWTVKPERDAVHFRQELKDPASGYGYVYTKTVRLAGGKAGMAIDHSLRNTGSRPIHTRVYNHNFLVLDRRKAGPDFTLRLPFDIGMQQSIHRELVQVEGRRLGFVRALPEGEAVLLHLTGFGDAARDHQIEIENRRIGVGMRIRGDRPLANESFWSIQTVIAIEPFVAVDVAPGAEFTWKSDYTFYTLGAGGR